MQKIIFTDMQGVKVADASAIYQLGGFHQDMEFSIPQDPSKPKGKLVLARPWETLNSLNGDTGNETLIVKLLDWQSFTPPAAIFNAMNDPAIDQVFVNNDPGFCSQAMITISRNGAPVQWTPYHPKSKLTLTQNGREVGEFTVTRVVFFLTPSKNRPTHIIYVSNVNRLK